MPIGQTATPHPEPAQLEHHAQQVKLCSTCRCQLTPETTVLVEADPLMSNGGNAAAAQEATIVCAPCRTATLLAQVVGASTEATSNTAHDERREAHSSMNVDQQLQLPPYKPAPAPWRSADVDVDEPALRVPRSGAATGTHTPMPMSPRRTPVSLPSVDTINSSNNNTGLGIAAGPSHPPPLRTSTATAPTVRARSLSSDARSPTATTARVPNPALDITRLRVGSQARNCLYPGAEFHGTQKSGRNEYPVHVTIVDVDFASSFLCGYLTISGLTEDWPKLTTYFDAEIIGTRYGFLTQNWDATEAEDRTHWARFPAFRAVKDQLVEPALTIRGDGMGLGGVDGGYAGGAVFMRWKERFLVPDHRVHDINGASFAGFYYMCVDFNPQPSTPAHDVMAVDGESPHHDEGSTRRPTMSGFYYHQHSEPYQQLSLSHTPEPFYSSFEMR